MAALIGSLLIFEGASSQSQLWAQSPTPDATDVVATSAPSPSTTQSSIAVSRDPEEILLLSPELLKSFNLDPKANCAGFVAFMLGHTGDRIQYVDPEEFSGKLKALAPVGKGENLKVGSVIFYPVFDEQGRENASDFHFEYVAGVEPVTANGENCNKFEIRGINGIGGRPYTRSGTSCGQGFIPMPTKGSQPPLMTDSVQR